MTNEIKPPRRVHDRDCTMLSIFLAGTIDNGNSANWQVEAAYRLTEKYSVFNPRKDEWNADASYEDVREQAEWEMDAMDAADFILMNFLPGSQSPITLAELGLYAETGKLLVICPEGYWRKANVDAICERYGIPQYDTINEAIDWIFERGDDESFINISFEPDEGLEDDDDDN